jgi:hypothetical protein
MSQNPPPPTYRFHSSDVQISLSLAGQVLRINQLGPDFIILEDTIDHPPAHATIHLSINGHKST